MRVHETFLTEEAREKRDYRDAYAISVNGEMLIEFWDGEPEDANLARDFGDCFSIVDLMRLAYEAGKKGEEFVETSSEEDEF